MLKLVTKNSTAALQLFHWLKEYLTKEERKFRFKNSVHKMYIQIYYYTRIFDHFKEKQKKQKQEGEELNSLFEFQIHLR